MFGPVQVFGCVRDERRLTLRRPASKKRQGTKSREVGERQGSERYGDLMLAPSFAGGRDTEAMRPACLDAGAGERENGVSAGARSVSTGAGRIDRVNRVERDRRQRGVGATERESGGVQRRSGS
jgi:hypothetical protein